ncbi:MAG: hypothetical protein ACOYON_04115 [Fimbriimonas sp.]
MKIGPTDCERFARFISEREDRDLNGTEKDFVARHRSECEDCQRKERLSFHALNMLREATLETEVEPITFDRRVYRLVQAQQLRAGWDYWSPALLGAALACTILVAALQLLSQPAARSPFAPAGQEAKLDRSNDTYPRLELNTQPIVLR